MNLTFTECNQQWQWWLSWSNNARALCVEQLGIRSFVWSVCMCALYDCTCKLHDDKLVDMLLIWSAGWDGNMLKLPGLFDDNTIWIFEQFQCLNICFTVESWMAGQVGRWFGMSSVKHSFIVHELELAKNDAQEVATMLGERMVGYISSCIQVTLTKLYPVLDDLLRWEVPS